MIIYSSRIMTIIGWFTHPDAKAAALWPFVFLRYRDHPKNKVWIRHERIHHRQQLELLFVGYWLLWVGDFVYLYFVRGLRGQELYLMKCTEQECYRNQSDEKYLSQRKHFALLHYLPRSQRVMIDYDGKLQQ